MSNNNKISAADNSTSRERLRVLVMATSYPLDETDNSSVFLQHLYEHLAAKEVEVHIVVPADLSGGHSIEKGIHVHRFRYMLRPLQKLCYGSGILPNLKRQPLLWLVVPFFLASFFFASLIVGFRCRPSVIHGHWFVPSGPIGLLVARLLRIPFIITAHGGDAFSMQTGFLSWIKKAVARNADAWTANTRTTARAISGSGEEGQCQIIPMGVDTNLFSCQQSVSTAGQDIFRILFVGRLVEKKGVDVLLRAVAMLPQDTKSRIELKIIGSGNDEPGLVRLAKEQGISSLIEFVGSVSNRELPGYLSAADLFVGPSIIDSSGDTEGQGVVFLEAMACGLCVVASDVGGISDVIENGRTGILVPPNSPEMLSSAIEDIFRNESKRNQIAGNGLKHVNEIYSWNNIAEQFKDLYEKLLR